MRRLLLAPIVTLSLGACGGEGAVTPPLTATGTPPPVSTAAPAAPAGSTMSLEAAGINAASMDVKADPCQDFYQFTCGTLDGTGNLRNWWSDATGKLFKEQTRCIVDQYSSYEAVPGVHVNGELTAGENIADIGGLALADAAYRNVRQDAKDRVTASGEEREIGIKGRGEGEKGEGRRKFLLRRPDQPTAVSQFPPFLRSSRLPPLPVNSGPLLSSSQRG